MSLGEAPSKSPIYEGSGTPTAGATGVPPASFVSGLARASGGQLGWGDTSAELPSRDPALGLAIVTCMDARLDLLGRLGITIGDAHILRNAGGRVTPDVIRSLHLSVGLMNVREVGILHHTNCGLGGTDNVTLARRTGVDNIDFLPFQSLRGSVRTDVTAILQAGILPVGGIVWGAVYHLSTHQIRVIRGPTTVARASYSRNPAAHSGAGT